MSKGVALLWAQHHQVLLYVHPDQCNPKTQRRVRMLGN